ncbi:MAG: sialic acid TRAP transporter substrate-binding protein SiaP [Paraglaciecola chathamensis]
MLFRCVLCALLLLPIGAGAKPEKLYWGHVYETSEPLHKWALWAAKQIAERTNGRYEIDVFPVSMLGKEAALNESLRLGSVDIIYTGTSFIAQLYPPFAITDMPYIYAGYDHWVKFNNSTLFKELAHGYSEKTQGNHIVANNYYGERHVSANVPVNELDDMQGLKIRVPNARIFKLFPQAVNANPTPIAFSEVYMALQQGVVDAQENPLPTIKAKKLFEVQKHISLTGHMLGSNVTIVSQRRWKRLSPSDRLIFEQVLQEAALNVSQETRAHEEELITWFEQHGVSVHQVNKSVFRQATLPLHKPFITTIGQQNYDRLLQLNQVEE